MLFNGLNNPKITPFRGVSRSYLKRGIPWAHMSQPPNGISIGSVVFAQYLSATNTQANTRTHRPRYVAHMQQ